MKTVFKVGQEVYDQINFPNEEGKVIEIRNYQDYPILVETGNGDVYSYTLDGRIYLNQTPILSTSPYTLQGFEQKASVPTYEEALDWLKKNSKNRVIYADEAYINEKYERAFEALKKLVILRNYYNKGYYFEWLKNEYYAVVVEKIEDTYEVAVRYIKNSQRLLFFKSKEIIDKFLEEQKELLEIAKPLL